MKKLLLFFFTLLLSFNIYSQSCPTPSTSGVHITLDSTYKLGTFRSGQTSVGMCFYNSTSTNITATQFRVFYDKDAFASVDTIKSKNTSFSQYLQYVDNPSGGYVTITLTYTGTNSTFTIPDGALFDITFNHTSALATTYFSINDMSFNGSTSFSQTATNQDGNDYSLNLTNFGGKFKPQLMSFKGKFVNVTGTSSKNLTVSLEKKLKTSSTWSYVQDTFTNSQGKFFFTDVEIDTTAWDIRIAIKGDTMGVGSIVSVSDAQRINKYVLGTETPRGFDFYSSDVNGDNKVTISDVYGVYARVGGRFTEFPNSVKDVLFFTESEFNTIDSSTTNYTSTIPGSTNFTFNIIAGQPDSVTFYVVCPGDANNTGYNMARMVPIEIVNPNNANKHIIDVTTQYDNRIEAIEVNFPKLGVDAGDELNIPVKIKSNGISIGSLQVCLKFDSTLLEFSGVENQLKTSQWISFVNNSNNMVEWGGYDPTDNKNLMNNDDLLFVLKFKSKKLQTEWGKSPLYISRKFAGDKTSTDLNITPTDGIIQVFRMSGPLDFKDMVTFPNPNQGLIMCSFKVYKEGNTTLGIYDMLGKEQIEVVNGFYPIGMYHTTVDMGTLAPGVYLAILRQEEKVTVKRTNKIN
jgi:hypothetical protein